MSPEAQDKERLRAQEARLRAVWELPSGWRYFSNVNNQVVGVWYTAASFGFFLFAGLPWR
jgi:cytochrome c oxidase subunit I+III